MNPVQLNELGGKPSIGDAAPRPAGTTNEASTAQDHLWQQAMRQAQQQGFAEWFADPSGGGKKVAEAERPPPASPPYGQRVALTWSRGAPDHAIASSPSPVASQPLGVSAGEVTAANPPPVVRAVGSTASHGEVRTAPVAVHSSIEFANGLMSAFGRAGISVSTGSWPGGFYEQPMMSATDNTLMASAESAHPIRAFSNDEGAVEPTEAEPLPSAASSAAAAPTPLQPSDPLRVHAEWSNAGVRVWLGAEAGALDAAHALASHLQEWLGGRGERLLSLVCNGRAWSTSRGRAAPPQPHGIESHALPIVISSSSQEAS